VGAKNPVMGPRQPHDMASVLALSKRSGRLIEDGSSRRILRGTAWDHALHGIARPAGVALDEVSERITTAVGAMTDCCALGGWASGYVQGVGIWDGYDRLGRARDVLVHCLPGSQLRRRTGVRPTESRVWPGELTEAFGVAMTTLPRATFDELCMAPNLTEAVVALDGALCVLTGEHAVTVPGIQSVTDRHRKRRGVVRARRSLDLGHHRALNPWETRLRLRALEELPIECLLVNVPVFSPSGTLLGIPDLLDPESGLVLESDGGGHRDEEQHAYDNEREELFEDSGLTVIRFGSVDHRKRPIMAGRLRAGHQRALVRSRSAMSWTLTVPAWWHGSELSRAWRYP
jgi:hypothetical protein